MSQNNLKKIRNVSVLSGAVNGILALIKIITGYLAHSQALIADGIHSFSDLMADILVIISAKLGYQKADANRPYGYHRIETLGTIIIALLIMTIGTGILMNAVHNFMHHGITAITRHSHWVILAASLSVIGNEALFHFLRKVGKQVHSPMLEANAWHNRSDAFVSLMVLVSAALNTLGVQHVDTAAAVLIALLIMKMGGKMIWSCIKELIDTAADSETHHKIEQLVRETAGVLDIHDLRTRLHGNKILLDAHIQVSSDITVSEGHYIGDLVYQSLFSNIDNILDITIHIDAEDDEHGTPEENAKSPTRQLLDNTLLAAQATLPRYEDLIRMQLHYLDCECHVDLYFVGQALTDKEEEAYRRCLQNVSRVGKVSYYIHSRGQ